MSFDPEVRSGDVVYLLLHPTGKDEDTRRNKKIKSS